VDFIAKALGVNHAGFDIVVYDDRLYVLEFNVFFGNQGLVGRQREINNEIYKYLVNKSKLAEKEIQGIIS